MARNVQNLRPEQRLFGKGQGARTPATSKLMSTRLAARLAGSTRITALATGMVPVWRAPPRMKLNPTCDAAVSS